MLERVVAILEAQERDEPWAMGCTSLALARALRVSETELIATLAPALAIASLMYRAGYYARVGFAPRLTDEQRAFFDEHIPRDPRVELLPAAHDDVAAAMRHATTPGLSRALDALEALGEIERVGPHLYRRAQLEAVERRTLAALRERGRITVAEFRDLLGTSRKYAMPLLEWFDARGITRREGDFRMLAEPAAS